jgi:hypothetical protein
MKCRTGSFKELADGIECFRYAAGIKIKKRGARTKEWTF